MKRILSTLFCVFTLLGLTAINLSAADNAAEQNKTVKQTPTQTSNEKSSNFPALTGRVVDQARVLSQSAKDELETLLATHENNTTNQVVVVTIESLGNAQIEEYSIELARRWGIGQKGKDNGVVLVVAPNDKQVRIEVGYGLEGTLTDALSSSIINYYIIPEFKKGDIQNGINVGIQKIIALLDGDERVKEEIEKQDETPVEAYGIVVGMVMVFASAIFGAALVRIGVCAVLSGFTSAVVAGAFSIEDFALRGVVMFALFVLFFWLTKNIKPGSGANSGGSSYSGGYGGGRSSSGGGFSGGGGGFGGGGASGRW
ncbi:TPM domain-containing protein [Campylobacter sp.]|uniref:TPM domain-containing protein n=1 Tax=Campylobacter sp. TaxID=205 RepID=UPI00360B10D9